MPRSPGTRPMYRVAALLLSASAIRYAGQLVLLVLIARSTSVAGVGTYTVALAVCAPVYILAGFGIRTVRLTLRREVPTRTYERFLLSSVASAGALIVVIGLFLPTQISVVILLIALVRTGETFMELYGAMLQRAGRPGAIVAVIGTGTLLQVASVAVIFAMGGGLVTALACSAAGYLVVLLAASRPLALSATRTSAEVATRVVAGPTAEAASRAADGSSTAPGPRGGALLTTDPGTDWRVLFAAGLPTGIAIGMITLLSTVPQYLLGWVSGVEDAGRFAVLLYVVVAVEVLLHALAQSWIPQARRLLDHAQLTPTTVARTALRWTLLAGVPGLAGLGAAALLLPRVLGPEFAITPVLALPLACTVLLVPASFAADTAVVVRNRYALSLTVSVLALIVGVVAGTALVALGVFDLSTALWTFAATMAVRAAAGFAAVAVSDPRRRVRVPRTPPLPPASPVRRRRIFGVARRTGGTRRTWTLPAQQLLTLRRVWPALPIAVAVMAVVAAGPRWALGAAGAVLLVVVLTVLRIGVPTLLVTTVPLAFYVAVGGTLVNLAVSDVFLLLLFVRILVDPETARAFADVSGWVRTALSLLALLLALTAGTIFVRSAAGAPEDWTAFLADAVKLVVVIGYFVVCVVVFRDLVLRGDLRILTVWARTAAAVGALGAAGALLFAAGVETGLTMDFRATGTFEDPNAFATYLIMSIPLALLARHVAGRRLLSWHQAPILAGIIASFSRGALVGLAAVLVVLCFFAFRDPALRALRVVALLALGVAAVFVLDGAASTVFEGSRGVGFGEDVRFRLWAAAVDVWLHAPLMGVGLGQFIVSSEDVLGSSGGVLAHNTYLSILAEGGAVGAMVYLAIPIAAVAALLRRGDTVARLLLASGVGGAVMAVSLNLQNFRPIWLFLALAVAWTAVPRERDPSAGGDDRLGRGLLHPDRLRSRTTTHTRTYARTEESWI
ncbi:O-antigen ligase family protein [Brevibacterium jeotgali]|uniref:O-antigen ligase n=1 Tax=Brevibacterium jeotgali TaxID=1262550 RepID=A0A2H1L3A8_9MICO|nr:O-antigen ligase family protein [Brevibacterium jeotgali]TWC01637.1 O-antigen ligase [Brevibacterium jeotgali]SMY11382.1 O-antigen ligase [Brevibacterium jeotgali]